MIPSGLYHSMVYHKIWLMCWKAAFWWFVGSLLFSTLFPNFAGISPELTGSSPEFHRNFNGNSPEFDRSCTIAQRNFARVSPEFRRNFAGMLRLWAGAAPETS